MQDYGRLLDQGRMLDEHTGRGGQSEHRPLADISG